jgi:manganese transport protein
LAGQVVMEGFVRLRLRPWLRRLLTRSLAILPALLVIALASGKASDPEAGDRSLMQLLVLSQAILSFQLPFAIVPLVQFTSDRQRMGVFASAGWLQVLAWSCAALVVALNAVLIFLSLGEWAEALGSWIYPIVGTVAVGLAVFLGWVALAPFRQRREEAPPPVLAPPLPQVVYRRVGVAVELEGGDDAVLTQAAAVAHAHKAELVVVHVVEGPAASMFGSQADDQESRSDRQRMAGLVKHLQEAGLEVEGVLGFGSPPEELVRISQERQLDLLVLGTHGHRLLADLALGETVSPVLHRLTIPVLVVPSRGQAQHQVTTR